MSISVNHKKTIKYRGIKILVARCAVTGSWRASIPLDDPPGARLEFSDMPLNLALSECYRVIDRALPLGQRV